MTDDNAGRYDEIEGTPEGIDPWEGMTDADGVPFEHTQAGIEVEAIKEARRIEVAAEIPDIFKRGGSFILDQPDLAPAVWGDGDSIIWAEGEALIIAAPQGAGKTTLALQLVRARLGLTPKVLGYSVEESQKNVLYLSMDRPSQWRRAGKRLFTEEDRGILDARLAVWPSPPPYDMAQRRDILAVMCQKANADTVIIDSLKDAAIGLTDDSVAAGYNRARQQALSEGIQVLELHHVRKSSGTDAEPSDINGVYGSTWITSGAGSVVSLWGQPGDPVVKWQHLKQPASEVGPFRVVHDHDRGTSEVERQVDPLTMASRTTNGITALFFAECLFETQKPSRAQKEKARRVLEKHCVTGLMVSHELDGVSRYFVGPLAYGLNGQ